MERIYWCEEFQDDRERGEYSDSRDLSTVYPYKYDDGKLVAGVRLEDDHDGDVIVTFRISKVKCENGIDVDYEEIISTDHSAQAMLKKIQAVVDPGLEDEVVFTVSSNVEVTYSILANMWYIDHDGTEYDEASVAFSEVMADVFNQVRETMASTQDTISWEELT